MISEHAGELNMVSSEALSKETDSDCNILTFNIFILFAKFIGLLESLHVHPTNYAVYAYILYLKKFLNLVNVIFTEFRVFYNLKLIGILKLEFEASLQLLHLFTLSKCYFANCGLIS